MDLIAVANHLTARMEILVFLRAVKTKAIAQTEQNVSPLLEVLATVLVLVGSMPSLMEPVQILMNAK